LSTTIYIYIVVDKLVTNLEITVYIYIYIYIYIVVDKLVTNLEITVYIDIYIYIVVDKLVANLEITPSRWLCTSTEKCGKFGFIVLLL
jgi:hypothetical protein